MGDSLRACENLNILWATLVVKELARQDVRHFYVAPGSRSSPLAVAVARELKSGQIGAVSVHDERGAGFCAVGFARGAADGGMAAVITSSGTAVANLLPAVIEASQEGIPMVLLTGDRPPELRDTGANQSIDQVKIFSSWTKWFKDMPCPSEDIELTNVLADVDHAIGCAKGWNLLGSGGPVHLNFMFREPLAPQPHPWNRSKLLTRRVLRWISSQYPLTTTHCVTSTCSSFDSFTEAMKHSTRGVLVVGELWLNEDRDAVSSICEKLAWPVLADPLSCVRHLSSAAQSADLMLREESIDFVLPDFILQLGGRLVSKKVIGWIKKSVEAGDPFCVVVDRRMDRQNETFSTSHRLLASPKEFCTALSQLQVEKWTPSVLLDVKRKADRQEVVHDAIRSQAESAGSPTEPLVALTVTQWLSQSLSDRNSAILFVGNSMPIRDVDQFGHFSGLFQVVGNRGASGIDGILSSAIGATHANPSSTVCLLVGDMSFIHDLNALHQLTTQGPGFGRLLVVVVNNGGGGIFSLLPIAKSRETFSPWFDSAHGTTFSEICSGFHVPYYLASSQEEMENHLTAFTRRNQAAAVLEVAIADEAKSTTLAREAIFGSYQRNNADSQ